MQVVKSRFIITPTIDPAISGPVLLPAQVGGLSQECVVETQCHLARTNTYKLIRLLNFW
jgi:hypothetical protein